MHGIIISAEGTTCLREDSHTSLPTLPPWEGQNSQSEFWGGGLRYRQMARVIPPRKTFAQGRQTEGEGGRKSAGRREHARTPQAPFPGIPHPHPVSAVPRLPAVIVHATFRPPRRRTPPFSCLSATIMAENGGKGGMAGRDRGRVRRGASGGRGKQLSAVILGLLSQGHTTISG